MKKNYILAEDAKAYLEKHKPKKNFDGEAAMSIRLKVLGLAFEPQYKWHPDRRFRSDFAVWKSDADKSKTAPLLLEYQGGTWNSSMGHSRGSAIDKDYQRHNEIMRLGMRVLNFTASLMREPDYFEQAVLTCL